MSEKEKRKEKPKRNNRRFIGLSIFMIIVLLGAIFWMVLYIHDINNITLEEVRQTATALDDLGLHTATPTPNP
jgi:hypothetical protein